jgi:cell surface protein SprA
MQKIPLLDWTTLRASYSAQYNWLAASNSALARSLGNTMSNANTKTLNAELNFEQLYAKSRFLRAISTAPVKQQKNAADSTKSKKSKEPQKVKKVTTISDSLRASMSPKEKRKRQGREKA